jgi:hypothetical protein
LPEKDFWIYEYATKSLFENGYIRNQKISEAAKLLLDLYASDLLKEQEGPITRRLGTITPVTHYEKLVKELESEKKLRIGFEQANKAYCDFIVAHDRAFHKPYGPLKQGEPVILENNKDGSLEENVDYSQKYYDKKRPTDEQIPQNSQPQTESLNQQRTEITNGLPNFGQLDALSVVVKKSDRVWLIGRKSRPP